MQIHTDGEVDEMEQDAKQRLAERLDQSLLEHTHALSQKKEGPQLPDVYELQALTHLHHYLKTEYPISPAETEALLSFADPLAAANACWEANGCEFSVSICDLLYEIEAFETLPQTEEFQQQAARLMTALEQDYAQYHASLLKLSREELIERSMEIAAMRETHAFLGDAFCFQPIEIANLLKLQHPMHFLADNWFIHASFNEDIESVFREAMKDLNHPDYVEKLNKQAPSKGAKMSVREQLRNASQKASARPQSTQKPPKDKTR